MQTFTDGDRIKIKGKKWMHYGKVGTLKQAFEQSDYYRTNWPNYADFLVEMFRRQHGDKYEAWAIQSALIICADPGFYDRKKAEQDASREVKDGEIVLVDGEQFKVKFNGDYSSIIHFYRA